MTRRATTSNVAALLTEYGKLEARRITTEANRDRDLAPHKARYEKQTAAIVETANKALASINRKKAELGEQINSLLMAGVDVKAGTVAVPEVAVEMETTKLVACRVAEMGNTSSRSTDEGKPVVRAVACVDLTEGNREIEPHKFFDFVKAADRTGTFWECFKVLIGKAEKFLGQEKVDELAKKPKTYSVSIALRP